MRLKNVFQYKLFLKLKKQFYNANMEKSLAALSAAALFRFRSVRSSILIYAVNCSEMHFIDDNWHVLFIPHVCTHRLTPSPGKCIVKHFMECNSSVACERKSEVH